MSGDLVGAWRLERFVFTDEEDGEHFPLGESPQGFLTVTPDNYLSLSFMAGERTSFAENDVLGGSLAERDAAAASYVSFGGPCDRLTLMTTGAIMIEGRALTGQAVLVRAGD